MSGRRGPYKLKKRARRQQETRQRIIDATIELHGTLGPAHTTISAVAEKAGVQRLTVYRHFPDERSLFAACTGHFMETHPQPDPETWRETADPKARLRHALTQVYAYFADTEQMTFNVIRDVSVVPSMAEPFALFTRQWTEMADALAEGWDETRPSRLRMAAIAHALDFHPWHSLRRWHDLSDEEIIDLMVCLVSCAGIRRSPEPDQDEVEQQPQHRQPEQHDDDRDDRHPAPEPGPGNG